MNSLVSTQEQILVGWFEMEYVCPRCSCEWADEWTCPCNDRCPDCNLESGPVSYEDLSQPLRQEDYEYAAHRIASLGYPPDFVPVDVPQVSAEEARDYAEARLKGE